ncbi:15007_t:CDS:2, partial [Gigaspora rosea]
LQNEVYNNDRKMPDFQSIYSINYIRADQTQSTFVLAEKVSKQLYCKLQIVVVLLEQDNFGNGQEFTLNNAAILNLKRWTQDLLKECRIRRAVSLSDAWYLVSNRLIDDPLNYILGILGMLHPMIKYHFNNGEYKNFEDGMKQILRLACERSELSWLHVVDNLPVPIPGKKQQI